MTPNLPPLGPLGPQEPLDERRADVDEFPLYNPEPSGWSDTPAPDALAIADRPTSPQVKGRRAILVGLGIAAGAIGGISLGQLLTPRELAEVVDFPIPPGTKFVLTTISGSVTVRASDGAATGRWSGASGEQLTVSQSDGVTTLSVSPGADLALELPSGADLEVTTTSGDVEFEDARLRSVAVTTTSGDVDLKFASAPERVSVTTTSGDVNLHLPGRGYRYDLDTKSGEVEVPGTSGAVPIVVRTTSGDIEVDED